MNLRKEDEGQAGEGQAWQNQFWPSPFVVPIWDQSSTQGSTPFPFKLLKRGITERRQSLDVFNPPALTIALGVLEKEMPKGLHASIFISSLPWRDFCAAPNTGLDSCCQFLPPWGKQWSSQSNVGESQEQILKALPTYSLLSTSDLPTLQPKLPPTLHSSLLNPLVFSQHFDSSSHSCFSSSMVSLLSGCKRACPLPNLEVPF